LRQCCARAHPNQSGHFIARQRGKLVVRRERDEKSQAVARQT